MEGLVIRGRYPLTALWLLAERCGDWHIQTKVVVWAALVANGRLTRRRIPDIEFELERYVNGVVNQ